MLRACLWGTAGLLLAVAEPARACDTRVSLAQVEAVMRTLEARSRALGHAIDTAATATPDTPWLNVMVRNGLVEQVGQLQILRMLLVLRDAVTGDDNKQRVSEAVAAMLRTIADQAAALQGLVDAGRKQAGDKAVGRELAEASKDLSRELRLAGDCRGREGVVLGPPEPARN